MKPTYKKVIAKIYKEHCPVCGQQLSGNNSITFPWYCKCGVWEAEQKHPWNGEYIIKPKIED